MQWNMIFWESWIFEKNSLNRWTASHSKQGWKWYFLQESFGSFGSICVWYGCSLCLILIPGGKLFLSASSLLKCTGDNMHLSNHVYSICILCLLIYLPVIVSCNSVLNAVNGLVYFSGVLYICTPRRDFNKKNNKH